MNRLNTGNPGKSCLHLDQEVVKISKSIRSQRCLGCKEVRYKWNIKTDRELKTAKSDH